MKMQLKGFVTMSGLLGLLTLPSGFRNLWSVAIIWICSSSDLVLSEDCS